MTNRWITRAIPFFGGPFDGEKMDFGVDVDGQPLPEIWAIQKRMSRENASEEFLYRLEGSDPDSWRYVYSGRSRPIGVPA